MMKKLLTLTTLIFTVMFSSTSFADWKKVSETVDGDTYYVDFERIRKHDGYVYYWVLIDYLKPDKDGDWSWKIYQQGDCISFRYKDLSYSFHKEPMGRGIGETINPKNPEWIFLSPDSFGEDIRKSVCEYAN